MCLYPPVASVSIVQSSGGQWDYALNIISAAVMFFYYTIRTVISFLKLPGQISLVNP